MGMAPIPSTQEEFAMRLKVKYSTIGQVVKTQKLKDQLLGKL
jgi:hypothetical protein